ncbi:MAG TPA: HAD family phosphatase [Gemmatimonadales bacterium]
MDRGAHLKSALLLDYNGVIVQDESLHFDSFREVLGESGIELSRDEYDHTYLGIDDRAAFREAARRYRIGGDLEELVQRKSRRYRAMAEQSIEIVPGVTRFVREAARECHVAVVSGALRAEVPPGLERAGIADLVEVLLSSDDVSTSKPDPTSYRTALRQLAARHGNGGWRAVVIEDSLPGIGAARNLGAGCVAITTSHAPAALQHADAVWDSFEDHDPSELGTLWREVAVP